MSKLEENTNVGQDYLIRMTSLSAIKSVVLYCNNDKIRKKAVEAFKKCLRQDEKVPNVKCSAINSVLECHAVLDSSQLAELKKTIKDFETDTDRDVKENAKKFKEQCTK